MKFVQKLKFISIENRVGEKGEYKDKPYFLVKLFDDEQNQMYSLFLTDNKELAETLLGFTKYDEYEFKLSLYRDKYGWQLDLIDVI